MNRVLSFLLVILIALSASYAQARVADMHYGAKNLENSVSWQNVAAKSLVLLEKKIGSTIAASGDSLGPEGETLNPNARFNDIDGEFGDLPWGTTTTSRPEFESLVDNSNVEFKDGLSSTQIYDDVLRQQNGQRPEPDKYLDDDYIAEHLGQFDEGAVRFTSRSSVERYGTAGSSEAFVLPRSRFDQVVQESNGDLRLVEKKLGLDQGTLSSSDTMAAYIKPEDMKDIRMPSGNEAGANSQWIPGGYTNGGVPEAVLDLSDTSFTEIVIE